MPKPIVEMKAFQAGTLEWWTVTTKCLATTLNLPSVLVELLNWQGLWSLYMLWFNFILGSNLLFFCFKLIIMLLSCYYQTLPYPKTKEKKIWTKDKIEPQHIYTSRTDFVIDFSTNLWMMNNQNAHQKPIAWVTICSTT